jgi:phosphatidylglycerophosphate synthase
MSGDSWTHLASRPFIRPLIGTWVRPNHITTLRLLSGVSACACFALSGRNAAIWGGVLWLVSAFLDRADGELARLGNLSTPGGHAYDYKVDTFVNALFFLCVGVGQLHSWLGFWSLPLGVLTAASMFIANVLSERLEERSPPNTRAYSGRWGFDPDDALYLMAPFAWLGWLSVILAGAAVGATGMMLLTGFRLARLRSVSVRA